MKKIGFLLFIFSIVFNTLAFAGYGYKSQSSSKNVTTAGTALPLSATTQQYHSLDVCAKKGNTGWIGVGGSNVVASATAGTGVQLAAGDCYSLDGPNEVNGDLLNLYIDTTVNGEGVVYAYNNRA